MLRSFSLDINQNIVAAFIREERIIRQRTNLAMGHKPDGHEITPGQMVYVIEAACDDCDIHKVNYR